MTVTTSSKSTFGSKRTAKCKPGYAMIGSTTVECSSSAKWEFTKKDSICFKGNSTFYFQQKQITKIYKMINILSFHNLIKFSYQAPGNVTLTTMKNNDTGMGILSVCEKKTESLFCTSSPGNPPVQNYEILEDFKNISNVSSYICLIFYLYIPNIVILHSLL